jgi:hypothetical protein
MGEGEREASRRLNERNYPTIGLALNRLAYYDIDNVDEVLQRSKAPNDKLTIALKQGG